MATAASIATDLTTCSICLEEFDNPRSLPCLHAFCLECLQGYFKDKRPGDEIGCPMCRKLFRIPSDGLTGLPHNFVIQRLIDDKQVSSEEVHGVPCVVCLEESDGSSERTATATVYCVDCMQKLCERCSRPHRRMAGGAHRLTALGDELEVEELIQLQATAGRVLQMLPHGNTVKGVTSLDNLLYVLRGFTSSEQIEVYDKDTYRLQRKITVHGLGFVSDISACGYNHCAYISDEGNRCVRRVALPGGAVSCWRVTDQPAGLSVTASHSVLVTCIEVRKIKEFSTDGQLLHQFQLPEDVNAPHHTVQLSREQFIVCHGEVFDDVHRVCLIGSDGQVVKSYGGSRGSGTQEMNVPFHLAVDSNKFVYVSDVFNSRVLLLSPALTYKREVLSTSQLRGYPGSLYLDEDRSRLYVAVSGFEGGRVVVVGV